MKRLVLALVLLAPVLAVAASSDDGPRFSGYLWQGNHDSCYFVVRPQSNNESWRFKIPDGEYFWCKTYNADGEELEDTDLSDHQSITLLNAMGKKVTFIVYEIAGNGKWESWPGSKSSADETVSFGGADVTSGGDLIASGSLPEGESSSFEYQASEDSESVVFTWPDDANFWVKVYSSSGKVLGDYDLDNGDTITLTGGGTFKLKIYSKDGSGAWTARKGEE
jgi:hypothetical protein